MDSWMDGLDWMDGWMEGGRDGWMDFSMGRLLDGWTVREGLMIGVRMRMSKRGRKRVNEKQIDKHIGKVLHETIKACRNYIYRLP